MSHDILAAAFKQADAKKQAPLKGHFDALEEEQEDEGIHLIGELFEDWEGD